VIFIRIIALGLVTALGWWITADDFLKAFATSTPSVVEVSGILNIWAGLGCLFIGLYLAIYLAREQLNLSISVGNPNKVIIWGTILTLACALVLKSKIMSNVSGYVECSDLRKLTSRYSSRTYAISEELCHKLSKKH
jgi:hypothetical protein